MLALVDTAEAAAGFGWATSVASRSAGEAPWENREPWLQELSLSHIMLSSSETLLRYAASMEDSLELWEPPGLT